MRKRKKVVGLAIMVSAILFVFVLGLILQALWNGLMPEIFRLPTITYWQGLGLFVLAKILFGFGGMGRGMRKSRVVRGWEDLTPEERARFRQAMEGAPPQQQQ